MYWRRMAVAVILLTCLALGSAFAEPVPPSPVLKQALEDLSQWLGSTPQAAGWHRFLRTDALRAQIAAGEKADLAVLQDVLNRYSSKEVAGLSEPRFQNVRKALASWVEKFSIPTLAELPAHVRSSAGPFRDVTAADAEKARGEVKAALTEVLKLTAVWPNGKDWEKKLCWEVQAELAREGAPDVVNWDRLAQKQMRHTAGDIAQFKALREAIERYVAALRVVGDPQAHEAYPRQVEALAANLEAHAKSKDPTELDKIAAALDWLESRGQAPAVVAAVKRHYSRDNLLLRLSARLVTAGFNQEVQDTAPISDVILGTQVEGMGTTRGLVTAKLIPNDRVAVIHNYFEGRTNSETTGYNSGATIRSRGVTDFKAIKQISLDQYGFHDYPATAVARTNATPYSVDSGRYGLARGMAQGIAWSRVRESTPEANRVSGERAAEKVKSRLDQNAQERMARTNKNFRERFRYPLLDHGAFPAELLFNTTEDALLVFWRQQQRLGLAAVGAPPPADPDCDFHVRIHESMVNNFFASYFREPRPADGAGVDERTLAMFGPEANVLRGRFLTRSQLAEEMERFRPRGNLHRQLSAVDVVGRTVTAIDEYQRTMTLADDAQLVDEDGTWDIFPRAAPPNEDDAAREKREEARKQLIKRLGELVEEGRAVILEYAPGQTHSVVKRVRINQQPRRAGNIRVAFWHLSRKAITIRVDTEQTFPLAADVQIKILDTESGTGKGGATLEQVQARVTEEAKQGRTVTAFLKLSVAEGDADPMAPRLVRELHLVKEWQIRFDDKEPLSLNLEDNNRVVLRLRCTHFRESPKALIGADSPMEIAAVYQLQIKDDQLVATRLPQMQLRKNREGQEAMVDVGVVIGRRGTVAYQDDGKLALTAPLAPQESGFVSNAEEQGTFTELFKSEFKMEDITLPDKWQKAGVLRINKLAIHGDWLSLGWVLAPPSEQEADKAAAAP